MQQKDDPTQGDSLKNKKRKESGNFEALPDSQERSINEIEQSYIKLAEELEDYKKQAGASPTFIRNYYRRIINNRCLMAEKHALHFPQKTQEYYEKVLFYFEELSKHSDGYNNNNNTQSSGLSQDEQFALTIIRNKIFQIDIILQSSSCLLQERGLGVRENREVEKTMLPIVALPLSLRTNQNLQYPLPIFTLPLVPTFFNSNSNSVFYNSNISTISNNSTLNRNVLDCDIQASQLKIPTQTELEQKSVHELILCKKEVSKKLRETLLIDTNNTIRNIRNIEDELGRPHNETTVLAFQALENKSGNDGDKEDTPLEVIRKDNKYFKQLLENIKSDQKQLFQRELTILRDMWINIEKLVEELELPSNPVVRVRNISTLTRLPPLKEEQKRLSEELSKLKEQKEIQKKGLIQEIIACGEELEKLSNGESALQHISPLNTNYR